MTNFERFIENLTPEELSVILTKCNLADSYARYYKTRWGQACQACMNKKNNGEKITCNLECEQGILDWLEADVDDDHPILMDFSLDLDEDQGDLNSPFGNL